MQCRRVSRLVVQREACCRDERVAAYQDQSDASEPGGSQLFSSTSFCGKCTPV